MYRLTLLIAFVFVSSFGCQLFAQSTTSINEDALASSSLLNMSSKDWSFYIDDENHIYYIDFEKISVNLNDIKVKDEAGIIVLEDVLYDLPVDTIYELDMSTYSKGVYTVELRSFTGMISKAIEVD